MHQAQLDGTGYGVSLLSDLSRYLLLRWLRDILADGAVTGPECLLWFFTCFKENVSFTQFILEMKKKKKTTNNKCVIFLQ